MSLYLKPVSRFPKAGGRRPRKVCSRAKTAKLVSAAKQMLAALTVLCWCKRGG